MAGNAKLFGLAARLFKDQAAGSRFTPEQLRAARNVLSKNDTEQDRQTLYDAYGVQKVGAKGARKELRGVQNMSRSLTNYTLLGTQVAGGGVGGMAAAGALGVNLLTDSASIAKSQMFKELVSNLSQKILGDPALGRKLAIGLGRGLERAGAIGLAVEVGLAAGSAIGGGYNSYMGKSDDEGRRIAARSQRLGLIDPNATSLDKEITNLKYKNEMAHRRGGGALPFIGEYLANATAKLGGYDSVTIGKKEISAMLQRTGMHLNTDALQKLSRTRYFATQYKDPAAALLAEAVDDRMGGSKTSAEGATAEAKKAIDFAKSMKNAMMERIHAGDLTRAEKFRNEANEELGQNALKMTAGALFQAAEGARISNRQWVISQSPRAGARSWDVP
jgi:hypothetical protein